MIQSTKNATDPQVSKLCKRCKEVKPLSGFYKQSHTSDGHDIYCKSCKREMAARCAHVSAYQTVAPSTQLGIQILSARGIPTITGVGCGLRHVDLAAWGCVPIEVKTCKASIRETYSWALSKKQRRDGVLGFFLLVGSAASNPQIYIVPTTCNWLYRDNILAPRLRFKPGAIMPEMATYENAFELLLNARREYEGALRLSSADPIDFIRSYWAAKLPVNNL